MSIVFASASSQRLVNTSTGVIASYPFTIYGYFKFTSSKPTSGYPSFISLGLDFDTSLTLLYAGQFSTDELWAFAADGSDSHGARTMSGVSADTWFNGVAVFASATDQKAYVNGTAGTTGTGSIPFPSVNRVTVGAFWNSGSYNNHIDGECADIGLVPKEATSGEISDYASGISGKVVWPGGAYSSRNGEREHWDLFDNTDLTGTINSTVLTANGSPTSGTHPTLDYGGGGSSGGLMFISRHRR